MFFQCLSETTVFDRELAGRSAEETTVSECACMWPAREHGVVLDSRDTRDPPAAGDEGAAQQGLGLVTVVHDHVDTVDTPGIYTGIYMFPQVRCLMIMM